MEMVVAFLGVVVVLSILAFYVFSNVYLMMRGKKLNDYSSLNGYQHVKEMNINELCSAVGVLDKSKIRVLALSSPVVTDVVIGQDFWVFDSEFSMISSNIPFNHSVLVYKCHKKFNKLEMHYRNYRNILRPKATFSLVLDRNVNKVLSSDSEYIVLGEKVSIDEIDIVKDLLKGFDRKYSCEFFEGNIFIYSMFHYFSCDEIEKLLDGLRAYDFDKLCREPH